MKNSKGITLASLVIIIASIILLATMAISLGYRYLTETKEADETYFKEVLSNAVTKRENNHTVNSLENPRIGYNVPTLETFQDILNKYVPEAKNDSEILFDRGLWYIVDSEVAEELGVKEPSEYIDVYDPDFDNEEKVTVALVDYYTGTVFIIEIDDASRIEGISGDTGMLPDDGHTHSYNIENPTCTLDKKCLICGYIAAVALGHDYGSGGLPCTPIDDEFHYSKECIRCGMKGGYERHTDLDDWNFYESGDGTWYHYNGCSKCGWPGVNKEYEKCTTAWKSISDTQHVERCNICKHEEASEHELEYVYIDKYYHEYICKICGYKKVNYEPHEDDGTGTCIKCGCELESNEEPVIDAILTNKEYPDSKYVTDGETIQLVITAKDSISDVDATICGYGGNYIKKTYSNDNKTCTIELFIDDNIIIAQNSRIVFSVNCKSTDSGLWMVSPVTETKDSESYLIYDSIAPAIDYIYKTEY